MNNLPITFSAKLWLWQGKGAWVFVTVDEEASDLIKDQYIWPRKGFGSIPVKVRIGKTTWQTSVFPEKKTNYVLPIKKAVRDAEHIAEGDQVKVIVEVIN